MGHYCSQHYKPEQYKEEVLAPAQASQRTRCYPKNLGVTKPDIIYIALGDTNSSTQKEMVKLGF